MIEEEVEDPEPPKKVAKKEMNRNFFNQLMKTGAVEIRRTSFSSILIAEALSLPSLTTRPLTLMKQTLLCPVIVVLHGAEFLVIPFVVV
jgi:hypothetical protein